MSPSYIIYKNTCMNLKRQSYCGRIVSLVCMPKFSKNTHLANVLINVFQMELFSKVVVRKVLLVVFFSLMFWDQTNNCKNNQNLYIWDLHIHLFLMQLRKEFPRYFSKYLSNVKIGFITLLSRPLIQLEIYDSRSLAFV